MSRCNFSHSKPMPTGYLYPNSSIEVAPVNTRLVYPTNSLATADCLVNPQQGLVFRDGSLPRTRPGRILKSNQGCYENKYHGVGKEYVVLNQLSIPYAKDFIHSGTCDGYQTYSSPDPRTFDPVRNIRMKFNSPPLDSNVYPDEQYNANLNNYGTGYTDYRDINAGQIQYYVDKDIAPPYIDPVFANKADIVGKMFVDPMDTAKPTYERTHKCNPFNSTTNRVYNCKQPLSFMSDSSEFRENIMASNRAKWNYSKYASRNYPM
jgi:hypothetical protein